MPRPRITSRWLAAAFGLAFGLAFTALEGRASACKCLGATTWQLTLHSIDGDGDAQPETDYWPAELWLENPGEGAPHLLFSDDTLYLKLEATP